MLGKETRLALALAAGLAAATATPADAQWRGWDSLGGVILEQPECVSWGPNRIDCFARGTNAAMFHRWWDGSSWRGWENLGGVLLDAPECVSWGPNRIDCFARGTNRAMFHRWWNGSSWGGWENLGGVLLERPECVTWSANRIDCFARGADAAMHHRGWDGSSWRGWESLGGEILEQPECVSWGPGRIDCFARGLNRAMFHRWFERLADAALTISRHNTAAISDADADSILADASALLQASDGPNDVACGVRMRRSGNVGAFSNTDGSIDTSGELSTVFGLPGNVKVVPAVNWCANQFNTSYIGCGQTPGSSFITERFTANQEGVLWAHEYGHNRGLPHRNDTSDALMFPSIGTNRLQVNGVECAAFGGSGGLLLAAAVETLPTAAGEGEEPVPALRRTAQAEGAASTGAAQAAPAEESGMPMEGPNAGAQGMPLDPMQADDAPGDAMAPEAAGGELPPVVEFVTQIYFEGLPLAQAARYGAEAAPPLLDILGDPSMVRYHENAALTLGMIGDPRAVEPLIAYAREGAPALAEGAAEAVETAPRAAYQGRIAALVALGYLGDLADSEQAVDFLVERSAPSAWSEESVQPLAAVDVEAPREDLAKYAIIALGFTGSERAAERLRALRTDPLAAGEEAPAAADDIVAQSLEILEEVSAEGVVGYYESR